MLSIGKLAAGQARYYLDQAEGRVDVVESVGAGVEDYYAGGAEARGVWLGAGARGARASAARWMAGPAARARRAGPAWRRAAAGILERGPGGGLRSDLLGAEERQRRLRAR